MHFINKVLAIFGVLSPLLVAGQAAAVSLSPFATLFQTHDLIINSTFVATYDTDHAVISINAAESIGGGNVVPKLLTYKFNLGTQTTERQIGTGQRGFSGDGGPADLATYNQVGGLAVDTFGNIYFSDVGNNRIRKVTPNWQIDTVAGTGQLGFAGDGGPAGQAQFQFPTYLAIDQANNLYVYDNSSKRIRELFVDPNSRREVTRQSKVQTIIGGASGIIREDVLGTDTSIQLAYGMTVDDRGNIYYLDENRARRYDFPSKKVRTVMGNGTADFNGDGVPATDKHLNLNQLSDIAWIADGFLVISDTVNRRLRLLDMAANRASTLAGNGNIGASVDGTPPLESPFNLLTRMAIVAKPGGTKQLLVFDRDRLMRADILGLSSPTPGPTIQIGGTVTYYMNTAPPVQNVVVRLISKNDPSQSRTTVTDASGAFNFSNLPAQQSWQVYFFKIGNINGAISALDGTHVLQAVAGIVVNPPMGPQQAKACDVTGDGKLSALDGAKILRVVAGSDSTFPITAGQPSDWVFFAQAALTGVPGASYIAPNYPAHTFGGADLPTVGVSTSRLQFSAAVIGDCTGNWLP